MLQLQVRGNDASRVEKDIRDLAIGATATGTKLPEKLAGRVVQLRFAIPSKVKQAVVEALGIDISVVKIIVDDRTNRILILGAREKDGQAIDSIIKFFDQPPAESKEPAADVIKRSPHRIRSSVSQDQTIQPSFGAIAAETSVDPAQPSMRHPDPFHSQPAPSLTSADTPTDLVSLAVAYSDAVGQVQESQHDPAKLRRAERKLRTLRGIVEVLRSAKAEQVKLAESNGVRSDAERDTLIERKANLAALDKILATD
jgi:hypothetical protein